MRYISIASNGKTDTVYFLSLLYNQTQSTVNKTFVWHFLFHDLLLRSCLYHCVWSVITGHNLIPEKRGNNYPPHHLTPTTCLRNNIQLINGISPCSGCL